MLRRFNSCLATTRAASATAPWLVMDMDGTLTPTPIKAGGQYLPLSVSPCYRPVKEWLQQGGNVCVVSSAGKRMWRQVHDVLQEDLIHQDGQPNPGMLVMSGYGGAAFFQSDANGEMIEDLEYRKTAVAGGTCLTPEQTGFVQRMLCDKARMFLRAAAEDDTLLDDLSPKYAGPYREFVETLKQVGEAKFFGQILTDAAMTTPVPSRFLSATGKTVVSRAEVHGTKRSIAQVSLLGMPSSLFPKFFSRSDRREVLSLGLSVMAQPDSVVISRAGVDHGVPISWMQNHDFFSFSVDNALAVGDAPEAADRPLLEVPNLRFVSVAPQHDESLSPKPIIHLGNEEVGTAELLNALLANNQSTISRILSPQLYSSLTHSD